MTEERTETTMIMPCGCVSKFQDERYGKGRRVHNPTAEKNGIGRCTVCGAQKK